MPREFQGKIELDMRDSEQDWEAFFADKAPEGAPNVLVVLYDDTGQRGTGRRSPVTTTLARSTEGEMGRDQRRLDDDQPPDNAEQRVNLAMAFQ